EIWLFLMVNPDGRVTDTRYNAKGVDLSREWSYMWGNWGGGTGACSQPESKALRECMYNNQFVVHTTYHSGTEYISLPWSYRPDQPHDWNHIFQLAGVYSDVSGYPNMEYGQGYNGMYAINGSTKDSNYGIQGSISWSMEISYSKHPPASQIMMYYNRNYPSMIAMIEYSGYGLEGTVTDSNSGNPVTAAVFINDYFPTYTDTDAGDYHKYVLPGTYSITIVANGYQTQTIDGVVVTSNSSTATDFQLQPEEGHYVYKFSASRIPGNNFADEGWTPAVIGEPDDINYSIGKNGWCVLDMQYPVIDGPGPDFIVYEGDSGPEGYTCYVGETIDGPWISLGEGNGTTEFDIINSGLPETQFIKLTDDGDGNANTNNAGFDLDAIEGLEPVSGIYLILYEYTIDDSNGNNNGRIDPGEDVDILVTVRNNGDITAEDIEGLVETTSPYVTIINADFNFGDLAQGETSQGVFSISVDNATPIGQNFSLNLNVSSNGGTYNNTFLMNFTVGLIIEDWETGNFDQFEWETGGNSDWFITNVNPYEGVYCSQSGDINHNQSSYLFISYNVIADGEISFYKKVSSESGWDYFRFYIDNTLQGEWSGDISWSEETYPVTSGNHTFKWEYDKDGSVSSGSDCGWIDYIILPTGAIQGILSNFIADDTEICETESVSFTDLSTGNITSWEWTFEGGSPGTSSEENPVITYDLAGNYDVTLTVSDGSNSNTLTIEDYITVNTIPEIPATPEGPVNVVSFPNMTDSYSTTGSANADDYSWIIEPAEAGALTENGTECIIDWTDYWTGTVNLSVKAINDCGESDYSESLEIFVIIDNIEESTKNHINIFPNPGNGEFTINFENHPGNLNVKVLNFLGKIIYESNIENTAKNSMNIDLNHISRGVYFVKINTLETEIVRKIIIR
ncbi:MAG: T9SS type A sorting domain-containing protein, partial [Bacteroidales bacterium]|nr:T9SS type A sorting domain-containing protein [Bacteroidales bacterium]